MSIVMKMAKVLENLFFGWLATGISRYAMRKAQAHLWTPSDWIATKQCQQCRQYTLSNSWYCSDCGAPQWTQTEPLLESTVKRATLLKTTSK